MPVLRVEFGDWEWQERLGLGATAEVFLAHQRAAGARQRVPGDVALKRILPHLRGDVRAEADFAREVAALTAISSPHVPGLVDHGSTAGFVWLAMPRMPGAHLDLSAPMPPKRLIPLALAAARALADVHDAGWIHGDVSMRNLLLADSPAGQTSLSLLDFGLARRVDSPADPALQERGTPAFQSPEQVAGLPVTQASDVFSLASVLWSLALGRPRFGGEAREAVTAAIAARAGGDLGEIAGLGGSAEVLVAMGQWEPGTRPSARVVVGELARIVG